MTRTAGFFARVLGLAALLAAAPIAVSPHHGVTLNNAMCTGNCCREELSICNAGGGDHLNYYYLAMGECTKQT
jgi:hypothetical protein